jgi:MFS family permease
MLEESLGRSERRATAVVLTVLVIETIWVFLHRYLPLDASVWALHSDLVRAHLSGHTGDGWKLIPYPAANTLVPFISGLLNFVFSGEVVTRLLQSVVGILLRGVAAVVLLRVMRVRDEGVYYLIPVIVFSAVFFSGSIPYMAGEALAMGTVALLLAQYQPRGGTYGLLAIGFTLTALCSALAFIVVLLIVFFVSKEQRRNVHLSQGWLSSARAVMGLALPGVLVLVLSVFSGTPVFKLSTTGLLPMTGGSLLRFCATPVPAILEGMLRGTNIFQIIIAISVAVIVLGFSARAFMLAIEEVTWQSRSLKSTAFVLLLLVVCGIWFTDLGLDTPALIGITILIMLAGFYSRGPAVRRTMVDRILMTASVVAMITCGIFNGFSLNRGSEASSEAIKRARGLIAEERSSAKSDEHIDTVRIAMVVDSALAQAESGSMIATFMYSLNAPIYVLGRGDILNEPSTYQPMNGGIHFVGTPASTDSSALPTPQVRRSVIEPLRLNSPTDYVNPQFRILSLLTPGTSRSKSFGPYDLSLQDTIGGNFEWGEAQFRLLIGKFSNAPVTGLAFAE